MLKIKQCDGNGQGTCVLCEKNGKWNRMWMCFLYRIEGIEGTYCYNCANKIISEMGGETCDKNSIH